MLCSSTSVSVMMENWEGGGDLADIVRARGIPSSDSWQFSTTVDSDFHSDLFGDPPFSSTAAAAARDDREEEIEVTIKNTHQIANNNIFSRMLQISPIHVSPCGSPAETAVPGKRAQISSPGNTGIKRRRGQAKKVVCIPAPTPASSSTRSTGEVVPSDLWAWRKYGQKPIKGSPYPRGYYRCSSSKGCLARKQVERSRNDPNMLVITYSSEHNHPWPTQRNALAGSTRSQPNKVGINSKSKSSTCNSQPHKVTTITKEEEEPNNTENSMVDSNSVKEEQMDMDGAGDDGTFGSDGFDHDHTLISYKPTLPDYNLGHCDDLFADLGEIDADSIGLLFGQEKGGNKFDHFSSLFDWNMEYY